MDTHWKIKLASFDIASVLATVVAPTTLMLATAAQGLPRTRSDDAGQSVPPP